MSEQCWINTKGFVYGRKLRADLRAFVFKHCKPVAFVNVLNTLNTDLSPV
jgi:hypothetical protein